jgi:hypothetical protein
MIHMKAVWKFVTILCILAIIGLWTPATARGPTIKDIQQMDTIFVYEENLNLSGLTSDGQVAYLAKVEDGSPQDPRLNVGSNVGSWDVPTYLDDEDLGTFAYFNGTGVKEGLIIIEKPMLELSVTLASPYHGDSVLGLDIPGGTAIAFKVITGDVGDWYRVGNTYPASIDILLTEPGGAQFTSIGGKDLRMINVTSSIFYTDDPGKPGPITLGDLEAGTYSVQARWNTPRGFADYAEDSNSISFKVDGRVGIETTPTATATTTPIPTTVIPTPTETITTQPTPVETGPPPTTPVPTTAEPTVEPAPTPAPVPAIIAIFALVIIAVLFGFEERRKK